MSVRPSYCLICRQDFLFWWLIQNIQKKKTMFIFIRFGGGYYYILCCATVNDGKLDEASGYGHSLKPGFLIASFRLLWPYTFVHPADNNYKAWCAIYSVCLHNRSLPGTFISLLTVWAYTWTPSLVMDWHNQERTALYHDVVHGRWVKAIRRSQDNRDWPALVW